MIQRTLQQKIHGMNTRGKAIMIIGPRQVGKTTMIRQELEGVDYHLFDGDDPSVRTLLDTPNTATIRRLIGDKKTVFIDEAQRIANIGLTVKIIIDQLRDVQVWLSGSSSFTLGHALNEPLTGRKWQYEMYPISWEEYQHHVGYLEAEQNLERRLLYGFYPDIINYPNTEHETLLNLVNSSLYSDILSYAEIRKPEVLEKLVLALALQVGNEVNYTELAALVGVDKNTVMRYIDILEKGYIVFRLRSYSRNLRNEIKKNQKIYFYDVGIRNMIIGDFSPLSLRQDKGALWENFLLAERRKQNAYKRILARPYFWRTTKGQEIDYVEERGQRVFAYEFKWSERKQAKLPSKFLEKYEAEGHIINRQNFREFIIINDRTEAD